MMHPCDELLTWIYRKFTECEFYRNQIPKEYDEYFGALIFAKEIRARESEDGDTRYHVSIYGLSHLKCLGVFK